MVLRDFFGNSHGLGKHDDDLVDDTGCGGEDRLHADKGDNDERGDDS
jgi:hypothetical protein